MTRFIMAYAVFSYFLFMLVFCWMAAFLLDLNSLRSAGIAASPGVAALTDFALISVFGLAHSIMARPSFKAILVRIIPPSAERATYVLQSSLLLAMVFAFWQPIPGTIWQIDGIAEAVLLVGFGLGLSLIVVATFQLDHFEFTGLKQAWMHLNSRSAQSPHFRTPFLYRIVRHPMQLGLVLAMFSVPHMTVGGMLYALTMIAYIRIGLHFEERSLVCEYGQAYVQYRKSVPMLFPNPLSLFTRAPTGLKG